MHVDMKSLRYSIFIYSVATQQSRFFISWEQLGELLALEVASEATTGKVLTSFLYLDASTAPSIHHAKKFQPEDYISFTAEII